MAAGIGNPTVTPVQVTAGRVMFVLAPPEVEIDATIVGGPGTVSVRSIVSPLVIGSGPLFVTETVHVAVPPGFTGDGATDFTSWRSYRHGSQSITIEPTAPGPAAAGEAVPAAPVTDVGAVAETTGEVAFTQLEPPPPPAPVTFWLTVDAPPPPPVYPPPPPPALS